MDNNQEHGENQEETKLILSNEKKVDTEEKENSEGNLGSEISVPNDQNLKEAKKRKRVYTASLENLNKKTKRDVLFKHLHTVLSPEEIVQVFVRRDEGFIKLTTEEAFQKALKLHGTELDGKKIKVRDPNDEEKESEEENDSSEPPAKKQKTIEEDGIVYEKVLSDSDNDDDDDDDDSDKDEDDSDEDEDKVKGEKIKKLLLKKQKQKKPIVQKERQIVKRYAAFIGNLDYSTTDNQVRTFIESIVAPEDIKRFFRPKTKDKPRGFGFVELQTKEALDRVLKLNGSKLMGRHVRIGIDDKQKKAETDSSSPKSKAGKGQQKNKKK